MPVIQTGPDAAGGGGGDATAANQVLQLAQDATAANQTNQVLQLEVNSLIPSVFKDAGDKSVFNEDSFNNSVFKDPTGNSNFYLNGSVAQHTQDTFTTLQSTNSILSSIELLNKNAFTNSGNALAVNTNCNVITFADVTLAGVGAQLQAFLRGVGIKTIISITFSSASAAQHDVICVYVDF
jgi:hypothetical protein